jgi:hypothetical protein
MRSIVVPDHADAAPLRGQRVALVVDQVQVERLNRERIVLPSSLKMGMVLTPGE